MGDQPPSGRAGRRAGELRPGLGLEQMTRQAPATVLAAPQLGRSKLQQRPQLARAAERVRDRLARGQGDRGQQAPVDLDPEQRALGRAAGVELCQALEAARSAVPEAADADPVDVDLGGGEAGYRSFLTSW